MSRLSAVETINYAAKSARVISYIIDWIIGGIFSGLPAVVIYGVLSSSADMFSGLYAFEVLESPNYWTFIAGVLSILAGVFYYIIIPWRIYPGQTLGKKLIKIKIERIDNKNVDLRTLFIRNFLCLFLLEGIAVVPSTYIRQLITIASRYYVDNLFSVIWSLITLFSLMFALGTVSGRALHDYAARTVVVEIKNG